MNDLHNEIGRNDHDLKVTGVGWQSENGEPVGPKKHKRIHSKNWSEKT